MNRDERRSFLLGLLKESEKPRTGAELAALCGVSRQIIVKDIAALRGEGRPIQPTPSGYRLLSHPARCIVACRHEDPALLAKELYTIVEGGGTVVDVFVHHPRYGVLRNELHIGTSHDVAKFLVDMQGSHPLCSLTDGVHMHTIQAPDQRALDDIVERLEMLGVLID